MSEEKGTYQVNSRLAMSKNYSMRVEQVGKIAQLAEQFKVSQGSVVRVAVDLLWELVEEGARLVKVGDDDVMLVPVIVGYAGDTLEGTSEGLLHAAEVDDQPAGG